MNFQEKMLEATAELRARAAAIANVAVATARVQAKAATQRAQVLKIAGRELNKVARRHAQRFVKENSIIAVDAGKDVTALARTTYATLAKRPATAPKSRKAPAARKRATRKAA
jgi:hypothetical protein